MRRDAKKLMRGVLLLRRIEFDLDGFLLVVDIEDLAEGLIPVGVDLDLDAPLGNAGEGDAAILIGSLFELGADIPSEAGSRMFGVSLPPQDDFGAVDGPPRQTFHRDRDFGFSRGPQGECRESPEKYRRQWKGAQKSTPNTHRPIIIPVVLEWNRQLTSRSSIVGAQRIRRD